MVGEYRPAKWGNGDKALEGSGAEFFGSQQ